MCLLGGGTVPSSWARECITLAPHAILQIIARRLDFADGAGQSGGPVHAIEALSIAAKQLF